MTPANRAERMRALRGAFRRCFATEEGEPTQDAMLALGELAQFCFVDRTTADADPQAMQRNEGRRQVYLHIMRCMNVSDQEIEEIEEIGAGEAGAEFDY